MKFFKGIQRILGDEQKLYAKMYPKFAHPKRNHFVTDRIARKFYINSVIAKCDRLAGFPLKSPIHQQRCSTERLTVSYLHHYQCLSRTDRDVQCYSLMNSFADFSFRVVMQGLYNQFCVGLHSLQEENIPSRPWSIQLRKAVLIKGKQKQTQKPAKKIITQS